MKVERIEAISLDKKTAKRYAEQIAGQETGQRIKKIAYLGGGSFGRAYGIECADGRKIVIKFLRAEDMLEKETFDLKLLAAHCPVKIPGVLFVRKADDCIPVDCYGMERIDGKNALMSLGMLLRSKKRRKQFAGEVVDALHRIHCKEHALFGDTLAPDCTDWLDYYRPFA